MSNNIAKYQELSAAIAWMRFPLIFLIVMLHCYCAIDAHGHSSFFKMVYPLGLILGETGVPAFFLISGFLFFNSTKSYRQKIQSRVHSLLIPYVFWNGLILLVYLLLEHFGHPMQIMGKSMADYGLQDYLRAFIDRGSWDKGNGVPMLCPYWYIRNLILLSVISPILYYGIRYLKMFFIAVLFTWWITIPYNGMIVSSLLFFCLGAYFSIEQKNPIILLHQHKTAFLIIWSTILLIDWAHCFWYIPYALQIHRVCLLLNIFLLLLIGSYYGSKQYPGRKILEKSAFWIYTIHYPMTVTVGASSARYLRDLPGWQVFVFYWTVVLLVTTLCVGSYVIFHRLCPKVLSFVTGNRS